MNLNLHDVVEVRVTKPKNLEKTGSYVTRIYIRNKRGEEFEVNMYSEEPFPIKQDYT